MRLWARPQQGENATPINAFDYREGTKCFGVCHGHQRAAFSLPPLNMSGRTNEASMHQALQCWLKVHGGNNEQTITGAV